MVGYQSTANRADRPGAPQALTAVLLRPASRGAVPTVSIATPHAALALDVEAAGATAVSYELRSADAGDSLVASGQAPAPAAGSPLLLVIPTFTLRPEQQYILSVRDAAEPQRSLGDFRFAATP